MACFHPLLAVDYSLDYYTGRVRFTKDGKHLVKILKDFTDLEGYRKKYGKQLMMLPCGKCVACAKDYARTWQARIMAEAQYHQKKCFVTLTYKDAPEEPLKEDLRRFVKNCRNKFGAGLKFFGAGEKGSITGRSHYHIILFGVDFSEDREIQTKRGLNYVYGSKTLDDLWEHKGFASLGSLDVASAGYVSQYCDKKKISKKNSGEFVIMSRGLGKQYFIDNKDFLFDSDYLYFDGNKFKFPRYFIKLANQQDFYTKLLAEDYSDRKRNVAQNFRYDENRSVETEELGMMAFEEVTLHKYHHEKGDVRDVI